MKRLFLFFFAAIGLSACQPQSPAKQGKQVLKFHEDGKFKIAQFTDMHLVTSSPNTSTTLATIKHVLETEKPDVAILTGDQAIDEPSQAMFARIASTFDEAKMPFALVFGNHDGETITKTEAYQLLSQSPYFLGEVGPEDIYGVGNYVLPVHASQSDRVAALLYCIDSNDYPKEHKQFGGYDWIHHDQINWYRRQSAAFTQANGGQPLPALAFFHIPLVEWNNIVGRATTYGHAGESPSPGKLNTGMFAAFVEMGDVKGVFVGHDHNDDYIGQECGIALAFGRVTGADAYGELERGSRIIELTENETSFTTWIRTPKVGVQQVYYYPSGVTGEQEANAAYLPALNVNPTKQGVSYNYYEGKFKAVAEMLKTKVRKTGTQNYFSLENAAIEDGFGFEFQTLIQIPEKGIYYFYTYSDDGSKLYIDGNEVVDNDGSHSKTRKSGKAVGLEAGFHDLRLLYLEDHAGQFLEVGLLSKNLAETTIPEKWLYLPK
ncbi:metallophosphatase [Bacteroidia bacterium]|nr:metallophosphatase [Bacteroidia bacterium]